MREIQLVGLKADGRTARVDDEDYALVSAYRWRVIERPQPNGRIDGPYAMTTYYRDGCRIDVYMHTLLTGWPLTDHENGNGLDNQRANLRQATKAQNNFNQRPQRGTSSRFKGVTWHKQAGKWQASIKTQGKFRYLGLYSSEEDAARAYKEAAIAIQGAFAYAARSAA
jgi:hypothetical protein